MSVSYGRKTDGGIQWFIGEKLTRDQLEIAIEKHRKGNLVVGGLCHYDTTRREYTYDGNRPGCIMQHIFQEPWPTNAASMNRAVAMWFDDMYKPTWPDWMLRDMMIQAKLIEE